jgi:FAD:protein FMN transferase
MGTTGLVAVLGDAGLLPVAHARIAELESRWSRFRPDSEVNALRAARGRPVAVSSDTFRLLRTACTAWRRTDGLFDPTVADAMIANGYDRSFSELSEDTPASSAARPAPSASGVVFDDVERTIALPPGVGIDPGGIGKGLAADIVATELIGLGARAALVDIGGDIRCVGDGPYDGRWVISVAHPSQDHAALHLALTDAGVATSSCLRRRWGAGRAMHHIVDPATGRPAQTEIAAATVIAPEAWWAEALATAVIVAGDTAVAGDALVVAFDAAGMAHGSPELLELAA